MLSFFRECYRAELVVTVLIVFISPRLRKKLVCVYQLKFFVVAQTFCQLSSGRLRPFHFTGFHSTMKFHTNSNPSSS